MGLDDYGADRRKFATDSLHTFEALARYADKCRVCGGAVRADEAIRRRQHFVELAHAACGYLRIAEHAVHETRRPGTAFSFYEWRCPKCGLDACHTRRPLAGDDLQCKRCRPRKLEAGALAELVIAVRSPPINVKTGKASKHPVVIESGSRVWIRELREGASYAVVAPIAWTNGKAAAVRKLALSPV